MEKENPSNKQLQQQGNSGDPKKSKLIKIGNTNPVPAQNRSRLKSPVQPPLTDRAKSKSSDKSFSFSKPQKTNQEKSQHMQGSSSVTRQNILKPRPKSPQPQPMPNKLANSDDKLSKKLNTLAEKFTAKIPQEDNEEKNIENQLQELDKKIIQKKNLEQSKEQSKVNSLEAELSRTINLLKDENERLREQLKGNQTEGLIKQQMKTQIDSKNQEIKHLRQKIEQINDEKSSISQRLNEVEQERNDAMELIQKLRDESDQQLKKIMKYEKMLKQTQGQSNDHDRD